MTTKTETMEIIDLFKRLPNSPITGASVDQVKESLREIGEIFHAVLSDLPAEMVRAAAVQYLSEENPFFPTPGAIRQKAMDLQLLAAGIPTAAEAWGMVLAARQYVEPDLCEEGERLRSAATGPEYWASLKAYDAHMRECGACDLGGYRENYGHRAVAETVRLLGGRDVILTDNPVADRARFIEAYREVLGRERMRMAMVPAVAEFVENSRPALVSGEVRKLAARLEAK